MIALHNEAFRKLSIYKCEFIPKASTTSERFAPCLLVEVGEILKALSHIAMVRAKQIYSFLLEPTYMLYHL